MKFSFSWHKIETKKIQTINNILDNKINNDSITNLNKQVIEI